MAKDEMVKQTGSQVDNYDVKPTQFPVKSKTGAHGSSSGKDQMVVQSGNQGYPRHNQDGCCGPKGSGTPSIWGNEASIGPIQKNGGESDTSNLTAVSIPCSVNLVSGHIEAKGYSQTPVKEVPQGDVTIQPRN